MDLEFNRKRGYVECPNCQAENPGIVQTESEFGISIMISLVLVYFFGLGIIIISPFIFLAFRRVIRRCCDCFEIMESKNFFSFNSFKDNVTASPVFLE